MPDAEGWGVLLYSFVVTVLFFALARVLARAFATGFRPLRAGIIDADVAHKPWNFHFLSGSLRTSSQPQDPQQPSNVPDDFRGHDLDIVRLTEFALQFGSLTDQRLSFMLQRD